MKEYINVELQDKVTREGLLESLKKNSEIREDIETVLDDNMFNIGCEHPYWLGVYDSEFFYKSAADANHDMNLLIEEWKDEPLNVDYFNRTEDDGNDDWIDGNFKALEQVKGYDYCTNKMDNIQR